MLVRGMYGDENFQSESMKSSECVHTMPAHFENCRKGDGINSLQNLDARKMYLRPKNRPVLLQKHRKTFRFHHFPVFT